MNNRRVQASALSIALLAIAAMTTTILGIARLAPKDYRQSQALEASLQAENAAWAGIEHALLLLRESQKTSSFLELSEEGNPFGIYEPESASQNCLVFRLLPECRGLDRQLGSVQNSTPISLDGNALLSSGTMHYQLLVWHKKHTVGTQDLYDGITAPTLQSSRTRANSNPILEADQSRRLDMTGVSQGSIVVRWQPIESPTCSVRDAGTQAQLFYTWLKSDGSTFSSNTQLDPLTRGVLSFTNGQTLLTRTKPYPTANLLSLRFVISNPDASKVGDCFARYSIENLAPGDTVDLGFDVVEATGISGNVKRKIRVIVNRENGKLLQIYDFGILCQTCQNIETY